MFCTYITYHKFSDKFYVGKSSVERITKRRYKGGGVILSKAFKKYPPEEWITSIIATWATELEAFKHESLLVTEDLLRNPNCLNLALGGEGGYQNTGGGFTGRTHTDEARERIANGARRKMSDEQRKLMSEQRKGKPLSEAHKAALRKPKGKREVAW